MVHITTTKVSTENKLNFLSDLFEENFMAK